MQLCIVQKTRDDVKNHPSSSKYISVIGLKGMIALEHACRVKVISFPHPMQLTPTRTVHTDCPQKITIVLSASITFKIIM